MPVSSRFLLLPSRSLLTLLWVSFDTRHFSRPCPTVSKETQRTGKRDLLGSKRDLLGSKRDLLGRQKRPTREAKETY
jgi:hypothetical protein